MKGRKGSVFHEEVEELAPGSDEGAVCLDGEDEQLTLSS